MWHHFRIRGALSFLMVINSNSANLPDIIYNWHWSHLCIGFEVDDIILWNNPGVPSWEFPSTRGIPATSSLNEWLTLGVPVEQTHPETVSHVWVIHHWVKNGMTKVTVIIIFLKILIVITSIWSSSQSTSLPSFPFPLDSSSAPSPPSSSVSFLRILHLLSST